MPRAHHYRPLLVVLILGCRCMPVRSRPSLPATNHDLPAAHTIPELNATRHACHADACPARPLHDDALRACGCVAAAQLAVHNSPVHACTCRACHSCTAQPYLNATRLIVTRLVQPFQACRAYFRSFCSALVITLKTIASSFSDLYFSLKKDISSTASSSNASRSRGLFKTSTIAR